MQAAVDVHQLQDRHVARLAVGLVVQYQPEQVRALQAWFDQHVDGEGAVVGAQGFCGRQTRKLEHLVNAVGLFAGVGLGRRPGRCLRLNTVERWQLDRLRPHAIGRLVAVRGVAVGVRVLVDLRCGGQGDQQQNEEKTTTHKIDRKRKRWVAA
ncbi:hypothetical protein D3C85_1361440 [compost metagenome]